MPADRAKRAALHGLAAVFAIACLCGAASWVVTGCSGWDPTSPFEHNAPDVEKALAELDAGNFRSAEDVLEEYLGTGACTDAGIGLPDTVKLKPNGSFDLGLTLFYLAESFGQPFGDEEEGVEGPGFKRNMRLRSMEIHCALIIVLAIANDPSVPIELRARAHYLAGNLEFLRRRYEEAVKYYDEALRLVPGILQEAGGDDIGRDAAWNRAIALRRIPLIPLALRELDGGEEEEDGGDGGPDGADGADGPDTGDADGDIPDDAGDGGDGGDGDAGDSGTRPDGSRDGGEGDGPVPSDAAADGPGDGGGDAGPDGPEPEPIPVGEPELVPDPQSDDRILDQLEQAPTYQEQEAKNRGYETATQRDGGQVNRLYALLCVVWAVLVGGLVGGAAPAWAQGARPDVSASASAREVEVGEPFTVELKALSDQGETASDPQLRAPAGFSVSGPRISTQTLAQFGGGKSTVKSGLGATWTLIASAAGSFVIPAPSVQWNGQRLKASPIPIDVVPSTGSKPPASPFLLPGGPSPSWPFGGTPSPGKTIGDQLDDSDVPDERELSLDVAPDDKLFLRIALDKKTAVVGEQVTASFYVYYRADFEMNERHEAPLADFVRVQLVKNPGTDPPLYTTAGGHRYAVRLLDRVALFPVRAGELSTGKMTARFTGRKLGARVQRESNDVALLVSEPPKDHRPPGFALGDVGRFALSAVVQPKRIDQGQAVSVTVKVSGTGNLPQRLRVPERTGIEWLDPEIRQSIETPGGVVGGSRTFGYVVRIKESGTIDLGKIELPFWDPAAKKYEVAVAELGTIEVTLVAPSTRGGPAPTSGPSAEPATPHRDPFASLGGARRRLGAWAAPEKPLVEGRLLWLLVATPPLLFALFTAGERAARAARRRREHATGSAGALAARALRDAQQAKAQGDAKELAAAVERAVHAAIEAATGLKSRAVLLADLPAELQSLGVAREAAERTRDCLAACDALRFDPGASEADLDELHARGRAVAQELERG